jgi:hypothetical protein
MSEWDEIIKTCYQVIQRTGKKLIGFHRLVSGDIELHYRENGMYMTITLKPYLGAFTIEYMLTQ